TFTITVRPINDDPTLDAITDISVSEDTDTTPADGNNDEQNVSLTGITPGAGNEVEDVVVTAALADTTLIAFARGANIIGETLTVNGTTFSFVDDDTAPIAADQIRVKMSDSTIKVATAAKDAINSVFVATAVQTQTVGLEQLNSIAVSFDDSLVTASGEMAVSNQDDLITGLAVDYTPGANTAQLRYTPGDNQFGGTVEVTVEIEDAGIDGLISTDRNNVDNQLKNNVTTQTFLITVVPVNDVPTLPALADQVLLENVANTQTVALTPVSAGAPNELEDVNAGATTLESTTNVVMAAAANVIGETLEIDGTVFTYVTATGTATDIVVAAGDSAITVATKTAAAVNAQGGIDIARATDNFVALDVDSSLVTGSSTEAFAVSGQNDLITGFNLNGVTNELEYEVVPEAFGEATITITLMDAGIDGLFGDPVTAPAEAADNLSVDRAFRITVTPVNDAPTMDTVDPQTVNEDATEQSVDLTGISAGPLNELENTRFLPATIANTRSVAVAAGSRIIGQKLTVDSRDFEYVSGSPVGDQIQVSAGSSSQQVATATAARLDFVLAPATPIVATDNTITTDLSVTVPVASADHFEVMEAADIIASSRFVYTSRDATGTFFYTPSAVNFGQVTVTLTVEDAGTDGLFEDDPLTTTRDESADNVSTDRTFTITVTPDNDTPTLNPL
ncbi:MAG: hypothetical protein GY878_01355, partial [Fuerstiella sp.]|nr:hypothetical protein [Fuerstiella sp.]